jgi:DNA invertase Pin-like site-specific DNA recombinase
VLRLSYEHGYDIVRVMPHIPGHLTAEGKRWYAKLARAQRVVDKAEHARDETARQALAHGLGVRGAALALGIDKTTVSRRYNRDAP